MAERGAARGEVVAVQDQLQAAAALPRPRDPARVRPDHQPPGGPEGAGGRQPDARPVVGDAARPAPHPPVRGERGDREPHSLWRADRPRAEHGLVPSRGVMILVPGGTFSMGATGFYPEEGPVRPVTV